jgi:hypothetical protein
MEGNDANVGTALPFADSDLFHNLGAGFTPFEGSTGTESAMERPTCSYVSSWKVCVVIVFWEIT